MRIISNFKDYYDKCQIYSEKTFIRRSKLVNEPSNFQDKVHRAFQIGFCGNIYQGLVKTFYDRINEEYIYTIYYSIDEMGIEKSFYKHELNGFFDVKEDHTEFIEHNCPIFIRVYNATHGYVKLKGRAHYPKMNRVIYHTITNMSDEYFGPIDDRRTYLLSDYEFDRIKPPHIAYQEIESYVRFLGTSHKVVPEMDNQTKIDSHGFNERSFKRRK